MIYIQSNSERTLAHHFDCSCALYGAIESNMSYRLTSFEEVQSGKFDMLIKKNLFVGSVEFMREVFNRIGLENVKLPTNSNRPSHLTTLGEVQERVLNGESLFVKPIEIKLFSGLVLDGITYGCLSNLPKETKVLTYEVFKSPIVSEWRLYIHNLKIADSRNYSGDFKISPDYDYTQKVISENKTFPTTYVIDIGILENGDNVVIEFNDMWAIGNYGVPNDLYLRMLRSRYFDIVLKQ